MIIYSGWQTAAYAAHDLSTGKPETEGGFWGKYDFANSIYLNYLFLSPKNQARQLGERKPYQGKRNVDLRKKAELIETYGRLDKSF